MVVVGNIGNIKMNIDRIIKLAIEAKLLHESETKEYISECGVEVWISGQRGIDSLEKFATLIKEDGLIHGTWLHELIRTAVNAEVEACARVCDEFSKQTRFYNFSDFIAKAIRARVREKV